LSYQQKIENTLIKPRFSTITFLWGDTHKQSAIALGYGSLYNHSRAANADYESYYEEEEIHIIAYKDIQPGEEVTINYNNDPNSQTPMWFEKG
jgi:SET domain-containing protein